uniref:TOG domain-containing protein n=1 Tax=Mesocestoides corti TaxID=53468 RepID=A0A5K3FFS8_MESCO
MTKIKDSLSVNAEDWERRVNALKDLRNVVASGGHQMDDFPALLRTLETPVVGCLQDLRSQVVREACVTVAYLSQEIGAKFDHFAEVIMQTLLNLIPNSTKIMSTSAITAIGFIIRNTFASRLFPIIAGGLSSKSSVLRKHVCIFLDPIFQCWPVHVLERHMGLIQEVLRKGVCDADQDARSATRKAFKSFAEKFPDQVEPVLRTLDPAKRKAIERSLSSTTDDDHSSVASGVSSRTASQTNLSTANSKRASRPAMGTSGLTTNTTRRPTVAEAPRRNISVYGDSRSRLGSGKTSISQPASRETSPSRTGSECDYNVGGGVGARGYGGALSSTVGRQRGLAYGAAVAAARQNRRTSAASRLVPRSQGQSREGSPNSAVSGGAVGYSYSARSGMPVADKRPSLSSMSDAGYSNVNNYYRQQYESDDNVSETSSMCSERSGQSMPVYRRSHLRPVNGLGDIINLMSSSQWSEKKDGLLHLKEYLRTDQSLSHQEVMRVAEVLGGNFGESSSKVISAFMETVQLFIKKYHQFLHEWIYLAMVRLFNRQGQEVLPTHQKAIADTLAVIRSHFPLNLQFACCCRFITDDAMTPTLKVKARVLEYLKDLLLMMPVDAISNPTSEMVKGIARIIAWSTEPKSADVRRLASRVVIKLSDLNPAAFASVVQQMPKTSQDQSAKLLKTYQKTAPATGSGHEAAATSPTAQRTASRLPNTRAQPSAGTRPFSPISPTYVPPVQEAPPLEHAAHNRLSSVPDGRMLAGPASGYGVPSPTHLQPPYSANAVRQNGQNGSGGHHYFSVAAGVSMSPAAGDAVNADPLQRQSPHYGYPPLSKNQQSPSSLLSGITGELICPKLKKPVIGYQTLKKIREMPPEDAITEILQELSNYNDRYEQRKACMLKLIKLLRDGTIQTWEEHSKPTLLILLESLSDTSSETRALALRVLQELVRTQGDLISDYACLTVMKILEACNDTDKGV